MTKLMRGSLAMALAAAGAAGVAFGDVADTPKKKLCLAHLVGWGYDTVGAYDDWSANPHVLNPYPDKPLFPRGFENDPALGGGRRKQVETAVLYGIDGFVVDVVRMEACVGVMRAVYDAADGFDFKCVLCLDNFHKDGPDKMISVLANYARLFKSHPNSWIEDGRLVVFAYNLGMNAADWAKVEAALNADPATSIKMYARTVGEGGLRPSAGDRKMTQAVDGVYDFGCNGFTADEMKSRLREMRKMLDEKGGGSLCGGIAPGYMHYARGFYRPFLGTRSLRWSWEASLAADVDSVCLTTWNDYAESTQFEPSVANRATFLKINREYVRKWRGEAPPPRTPDAAISYQEEVLDGSDFEIDVLSFPYSTPAEELHVRLLDATGGVMRAFAPIALRADDLGATTLRVNDEEMADWRVVRVQVARTAAGAAPKDGAWRELPDVTRRVSRLETPRWSHLCLSDLATGPKATLTLREAEGVAEVLVPGWLNAGEIALLRDGFPVAVTNLFHRDAPAAKVRLPLPEATTPFEVYVVRYTDFSDRVLFTAPAVRAQDPDRRAQRAVVCAGQTFDEEWPLWQPGATTRRAGFPVVRERRVPWNATFALDFVLDGADFVKAPQFEKFRVGTVRSRSAWRLPLKIANGTWVRDEKLGRTALACGEKTYVGYRTRTFPAWTYRLKAEFAPEKTGRAMGLFSDAATGVSLRLDAEGRVVYSDRGATVRSAEPVAFGAWSTAEARFDGESLSLVVNGAAAVKAPVANARRALINSSPRIAAGFVGRLARISLSDE